MCSTNLTLIAFIGMFLSYRSISISSSHKNIIAKSIIICLFYYYRRLKLPVVLCSKLHGYRPTFPNSHNAIFHLSIVILGNFLVLFTWTHYFLFELGLVIRFELCFSAQSDTVTRKTKNVYISLLDLDQAGIAWKVLLLFLAILYK